MVHRGGNISPIPEALDPAIQAVEFKHNGKTFTVGEALSGDSTDGYIIVHKGKILAEEYFNGLTEKDQHILLGQQR